MVHATNTDPGGPNEWIVCDEPQHLRRWGASIMHALPSLTGEHIVGAADGCWLQLQDDDGRISRHHAKLTRHHGRWVALDLRSKNGIYQDGSRRPEVSLAPGVELGIGGITLIAESPLLVVLRELLARLLGWADERRAAVDLALRSVRMAATRRGSLQLCGAGDLVSVARLLHSHTLGEKRPFVVCDPLRRAGGATARTAANYDNGMAALAAAAGGTLCVWQHRRPADYAEVIEARRDPACRVQLVVCTNALEPSDPLIASPIVIPPLHTRAAELDRVIDAYALDGGAALASSDRQWIRDYEARTLAKIATATRRLVAIRTSAGSVSRAAARLGMSHGALSEWLARRDGVEDDDGE